MILHVLAFVHLTGESVIGDLAILSVVLKHTEGMEDITKLNMRDTYR
jgi:hypothetical protein